LKITALTAVNLNKKYLSCVPFFIDFWLSMSSDVDSLNFTPKVLVIAKSLPAELEPYRQWCEIFEVDSSISSSFVSQAVRILQPSLEDADYVITTDADMLPLGNRVFQAALNSIRNGAEFVVCRDVLDKGQFPICYNLASPETWRKVNGIRSQVDVRNELSKMLQGLRQKGGYKGDHGGLGWFADQTHLFSMVSKFEALGGQVARLKDRDTNHHRLDRLFMPFPLNWLALLWVSRGYFTDYHVHHPVGKFKKYISKVANSKTKYK